MKFYEFQSITTVNLAIGVWILLGLSVAALPMSNNTQKLVNPVKLAEPVLKFQPIMEPNDVSTENPLETSGNSNEINEIAQCRFETHEICGYRKYTPETSKPTEWVPSWCQCCGEGRCVFNKKKSDVKMYEYTCVYMEEVSWTDIIQDSKCYSRDSSNA